MSAKAHVETFMIELDCLLDTRLGTISKMGEQLAHEVFSPEYITREEDKWPNVDPAQFKQLYDARDEETLARSAATAFVPHLRNLTRFMSEIAVARPEYDGIKIAINVYPYRLSDAVLSEIRETVSAWCGGFVPVELINISPEALSPEVVNSRFAVMVMYDYGNWMQKHKEAFNRTRCTEVHLIAPALYFNEKPDAASLAEMIREGAHPFQAAMMFGGQVIGLELVDIRYFSVVAPPHFERSIKARSTTKQHPAQTATA
jgi:hypothetical protein